MENKFYNEDFEKFLRNNADQYRMYPSEKVWKGIYSSLHTRRRWYAIAAIAFVVISSSLVGVLVSLDRSKKATVASAQNKTTDASIQNQKTASTTVAQTIQQNKQVQNNTVASVKKNSFSSPLYIKENTNPVPDKQSDLQNPLITYQDSSPESVITNEQDISSKVNDVNVADTKTESVVPDNKKIDAPSKEELNKASMALASQNAPLVKSSGRKNRFTTQFFITPAISYRKLSENKSYLVNSNIPFNYNQFRDVNNLVKHKPALGLEFGVEGHYQINDLIAATAGFQFNINRYDIRAFYHPTEFATITLNSRSTSFRPDSLVTLSNYRNFDGFSTNWIENFYFQVSMPIGVEFTLIKDKKFAWGVSGNVQPTYTIGDRAYLITTDYKNYVKVPNLMRRWNLNTGVGAFVSTNTGSIKWQVGPQLRYQHRSSFEDIYPVKENLFNVGFKIGATINRK